MSTTGRRGRRRRVRRVSATRLKRYGVATPAFSLATLLTLSLWPARGQWSFLLFLAAVAFSSWYGGTRPGLLAAALSAAAGAYIFLAPHFSLAVSGVPSLLRLAEFILVAGLVLALNAAHSSARERAEEARAQAEAAGRVKDEFLATVSHELRTPLNVILDWVHMIHSEGLDRGLLPEALERIERNAEAQRKLIEDLLDVSRIANGRLRSEAEPLALSAAVREVVDSLTPTQPRESGRPPQSPVIQRPWRPPAAWARQHSGPHGVFPDTAS